MVKPLTCLSPGRKVEQIAYPHSMVRIQAVVLLFQILSVPLDAEAMSWSSDETQRARTSCLCPGSSMVWVLSGSEDSGLDDFLDEEGEGEGMVYVSRLLLERARRSWGGVRCQLDATGIPRRWGRLTGRRRVRPDAAK